MNPHRTLNRKTVLQVLTLERLAWLWLLVGFALLPFTFFQTVLPLAGWLAPIFLLRFARTFKHTRTMLLLVFLAYFFGNLIAGRGLPFSLLGLLGNILLKGLIWTIPYAIDRFLSPRLQGWLRSLVFPLAFTTVDWLISLLSISSSGSPAYSQAGVLVLLQVLSLTGMWAITFLIMWFAAIVNGLWEQEFDLGSIRHQLIAFAAVMGLVLIYGGGRLALTPPSPATVKAATITLDEDVAAQATSSITLSFNQSTDTQRAALRPKLQTTIDQLMAHTETVLREGAKIVSWREGAGTIMEEDKPQTLARVAELARKYQAYIEVSLGVLTRTHSMHFIRNQSILIDPNGLVAWTYDKTHLVPYDEAFVFTAGPGILPLVDSPYGRLSTAICYDTYFPALLRQAGEGGTDLLIAPTNDVRPYATSALAMADYRSIENGFSILRPTGNGFSAMIDPEGRILAITDYFTNSTGILVAGVPVHGIRTIYSQIGDLFAYLSAAGLVILLGWALLHRRPAVHAAQSQALIS